jgi:hypothetical protein
LVIPTLQYTGSLWGVKEGKACTRSVPPKRTCFIRRRIVLLGDELITFVLSASNGLEVARI